MGQTQIKIHIVEHHIGSISNMRWSSLLNNNHEEDAKEADSVNNASWEILNPSTHNAPHFKIKDFTQDIKHGQERLRSKKSQSQSKKDVAK